VYGRDAHLIQVWNCFGCKSRSGYDQSVSPLMLTPECKRGLQAAEESGLEPDGTSAGTLVTPLDRTPLEH